jgi:ABC-type tungstate transport system permease subunit
MSGFVRSLAIAVFATTIGFFGPAVAQSINPNELIILTTTTTQDSGILRVLTDAFAKKSGLTVKPIVAGSGNGAM